MELQDRGPAGSVYMARDIRLERNVTLRVLPADTFPGEESRQRFIQDAQNAASLEHPNIGTIHEIDTTADGQVLFVMACYPGESLKERMERGPLSMTRILDYAVQLASALDEAHRNGVNHHGMNPSNILLGSDGILRLLDLGLAELPASTGSLDYLSPEQIRGDPVDERSDIWSLGVVLFEMLFGHHPFPENDQEALTQAILDKDPWENSGKPIQTGKLASTLIRIIKKCLSKYPIKRYPAMDEVWKDLVNLRQRQRKRRLGTFLVWNIIVVCVVVFLILWRYVSNIQEPQLTSRFDVVEDPFGLGQGKVLMLDPGQVDTSINRLIAYMKLPEAAQIRAVNGPHRLSTVYLKIGRPEVQGTPAEVNVSLGLAAEAERRHAEIFARSEYSVLAQYEISGQMECRDGDHYTFMYPFPFDTDTYYEIWFVIDHSHNNFDLYIRGGSQFPNVSKLVSAAKYRHKTLNALDSLLLITGTDSLNIERGGRDPVYFDDFYAYADGVILESPDDRWVLLDNFESGQKDNWTVHQTTTGPMPKRTRPPEPNFLRASTQPNFPFGTDRL